MPRLCRFNTGFDDNEQIWYSCPDYQQNLHFIVHDSDVRLARCLAPATISRHTHTYMNRRDGTTACISESFRLALICWVLALFSCWIFFCSASWRCRQSRVITFLLFHLEIHFVYRRHCMTRARRRRRRRRRRETDGKENFALKYLMFDLWRSVSGFVCFSGSWKSSTGWRNSMSKWRRKKKKKK